MVSNANVNVMVDRNN